MELDLLRLLVGLGVPSAIAACALIAMFFWNKYRTVAKVASWCTIGLAMFFGVPQVYFWVTGGDVEIVSKPEEWYGFTRGGSPTQVLISARRDETEIATRSYSAQDAVPDRVLTLEPIESEADYRVKYREVAIGRLSHSILRASGFLRTEPRNAWSTRSVPAGAIVRLGSTDAGDIYIRTHTYSEGSVATVTLELTGAGDPFPATLELRNKSADMQTFGGALEFLVIMRSADFTRGSESWATFTVVGS